MHNITLQGAYNFRDLGGKCTSTGQSLKHNLLFRSDELNGLTEEDVALLDSINIQTIIDFRTDQERAQSIDKIPATCANEIHLNILSADMSQLMALVQGGNADYKQIMLDIYKDLVLSETAQQEYKAFFDYLQTPKYLGLVYHCSAGKDRTGIATALIYSALGVDWADIVADYLYSNQFLQHKYATYLLQKPELAPLFLVDADYLQNAKDSILSKYDNIDNYLQEVLKVDLKQMKKIYVQ